jgi:hypothetical protein
MSVHALRRDRPQPRPPAEAADAFTDAVLEILAASTWPDGSSLIEVDPSVLHDRLRPQILAAAHVLAATSILTTTGGPR